MPCWSKCPRLGFPRTTFEALDRAFEADLDAARARLFTITAKET
jgi:hypothetical protein